MKPYNNQRKIKIEVKTMRNWIIVLLIFVVPLGIFAWLESTQAKAGMDGISANGDTLMATTGKPRMLKFSSPMCSDCKKVSNVLINVVPDYKDSVTFEEINVSDGSKASSEAVKAYKVTVVPTLIFVSRDGKIIQKTEGLLSEEEIRTGLNSIK